jgi:hypothetical protein
MRQTKYKNKIRRKTLKNRKTIKKNNKLRRKTIKNRKQVGGEISGNCTREIIRAAFESNNNNNLTQEEITYLTNKIMTVRTVWRENDLLFFNLLEQISNLNDSTYDEKNEWIDDIINMWQQEPEHQLN